MVNRITRWEPLRDMVSLREAMDRLFEESFVRPMQPSRPRMGQADLSVDIYEIEDALVVKAAVPGVKADDLDINITGDVLNIKGETKAEEEIEEGNYHRREFRHGAFCRSVRLPIQVDVSNATATFEDGILTLTLPKPKEIKPKSVKVKVNR